MRSAQAIITEDHDNRLLPSCCVVGQRQGHRHATLTSGLVCVRTKIVPPRGETSARHDYYRQQRRLSTQAVCGLTGSRPSLGCLGVRVRPVSCPVVSSPVSPSAEFADVRRSNNGNQMTPVASLDKAYTIAGTSGRVGWTAFAVAMASVASGGAGRRRQSYTGHAPMPPPATLRPPRGWAAPDTDANATQAHTKDHR
jgi:hypothetical protein